jgi:hypothetical protein
VRWLSSFHWEKLANERLAAGPLQSTGATAAAGTCGSQRQLARLLPAPPPGPTIGVDGRGASASPAPLHAAWAHDQQLGVAGSPRGLGAMAASRTPAPTAPPTRAAADREGAGPGGRGRLDAGGAKGARRARRARVTERESREAHPSN